MPSQREIAQHLAMSERNCRDALKSLSIDWTEAILDEIRTVYIRDLRDKRPVAASARLSGSTRFALKSYGQSR